MAFEKVTGTRVREVTHVYLGHYSLNHDVRKSKFTGNYRGWGTISKCVNHAGETGEDPFNNWVHQQNQDGEHKFGFRYESQFPEGEYTGMFFADGNIWYQSRITTWYDAMGSFTSTFPSGPGECEGQKRLWCNSTTDITEQEFQEYRRGKYFSMK